MKKYTVNITPKIIKMIESVGMFIEYNVYTKGDITSNVIEITEEDSDFLVMYGYSSDGSLFHITSPNYVEDLPAHIESSIDLRNVVNYIIKHWELFTFHGSVVIIDSSNQEGLQNEII